MAKNHTLSYEQGNGHLFSLGRTLGEYLADVARDEPAKPAIIHGERCVTYAELDRAVDNLCLGLLDLGLNQCDRIGICLPDCPEYTFLYYAAARLGMVISPISVRYRDKEFLTILAHSEARAIAVPALSHGFDYVSMLEGLRSQLPDLEFIMVLGAGSKIDRSAGIYSFDEIEACDWSQKYPPGHLAEHLKKNSVEADDLLEIAYTSGTTGDPKGAMTTHNNRAAAGILNCETWGSRPDDVMLSMSPLTHSIGAHHSQNGAILNRFTVVYMTSWEPELALREAERTNATVLIGVPAMFIAMMNHPNFGQYDMSNVRLLWCAGSQVPYEVAKRVSEAFGAEFSQTYGSTELGGIHCTRAGDGVEITCGSVGPPVRGAESKIVDPATARIVPRGETGELLVRCVSRCLGYYKNSEATAQAIDPAGWFRTGDLGVMDPSGYVRIIGRIKDMIVRGGQNIYATEIEDLLCTHPAVQQAYVVGFPDDYLGERTCAFVVPQSPEERLTRDLLLGFYGNHVAKYKIPDRVETVRFEQLPLTPSGKVLKRKLHEILLETLQLERGPTVRS